MWSVHHDIAHMGHLIYCTLATENGYNDTQM